MKRLVKIILFILTLFTFGQAAKAQFRPSPYPGQAFRETHPTRQAKRFPKLDAIKNAYINKRLDLSPEEADRFWPLYNQYQGELSVVLAQKRQNNNNTQISGMEQANRDIAYEQQLLAIRKRYQSEFLKILPADKVSTLYKSEQEFREELYKQLRERRTPGN